MEKRVSVIILNYNKYNYTIQCVNSLTKQTYENFEVIILDNGSEPERYKALKRELKQFEEKIDLKLIRNDNNLYFGAGNNKAIKKAKGEFLCLLNYDTVTEPDFIEEMVQFLEKHPDAGMITPKIKIYDNKNIIWNAGAYLDFKSAIVIGNRGYLTYDPHDKKYNEIEQIGFAPGTALFLRREIVDEVGLIDEIFLMYHEDPDWNLRAQEAGFKSYYVPTTTVYHDVPQIFDEEITHFKKYFLNRNVQIIVWKYAKFTELLIFYYIYGVMNGSMIFLNFLARRVDLIIVQLKSLWQGLRIGIRRRTNRSCRKYLINDYYYAQRLQEF